MIRKKQRHVELRCSSKKVDGLLESSQLCQLEQLRDPLLVFRRLNDTTWQVNVRLHDCALHEADFCRHVMLVKWINCDAYLFCRVHFDDVSVTQPGGAPNSRATFDVTKL
jgi:hypothetical protein